jgi:hypothetical protein
MLAICNKMRFGSGDSTSRLRCYIIFGNIEKTYISLFQKSTNAKDARIPLLSSADASRVAPIFYKPTLESIQLALELSALLEEMTRRLE